MVQIIFGIDDTNPKSLKEGKDFGGNLENGVLAPLLDLHRNFPKLKITHFVPANYQLSDSSIVLRGTKKINGKDCWKTKH